MTKKSKWVLGGRPDTRTFITSAAPPGLMVTVAVALGRQREATGLAARTMSNSCFLSLAAASVPAKAARTVAATSAAANEPDNFIVSPVERMNSGRHVRERFPT